MEMIRKCVPAYKIEAQSLLLLCMKVMMIVMMLVLYRIAQSVYSLGELFVPNLHNSCTYYRVSVPIISN